MERDISFPLAWKVTENRQNLSFIHISIEWEYGFCIVEHYYRLANTNRKNNHIQINKFIYTMLQIRQNTTASQNNLFNVLIGWLVSL